MSKYTTQLRYICETLNDKTESTGFDDIETIILNAATKIFGRKQIINNTVIYYNDLFPFWSDDINEKLRFETLILRHYYTREISEETFGLWKLRLIDKLNLIMPYYNQLYLSAKLEFDPFNDVDTIRMTNGNYTAQDLHNRTITSTPGVVVTETKVGQEENFASSNVTENATNSFVNNSQRSTDATENKQTLDLYSDTPQGGINGLNGIEGPDNGSTSDYYWLTNARKISDDKSNNVKDGAVNVGDSEDKNARNEVNNSTKAHETTNTLQKQGSDTSIDEFSMNDKHNNNETEHYFGKQGGRSYSSMLNEYRTTIINIDRQVIEELEPLFMQIW